MFVFPNFTTRSCKVAIGSICSPQWESKRVNTCRYVERTRGKASACTYTYISIREKEAKEEHDKNLAGGE